MQDNIQKNLTDLTFMYYLISGLIAFVVLLVPVVYFFIERKYKIMTTMIIVNLIVSSTLIMLFINQLKS